MTFCTAGYHEVEALSSTVLLMGHPHAVANAGPSSSSGADRTGMLRAAGPVFLLGDRR